MFNRSIKFSGVIFFVSIFACMLFFSCSYNNGEEIYGPYPQQCDTLSVSYTQDIIPILQNNCYNCHSTANAELLGGEYILDTYDNLKEFALSGELVGGIDAISGYVKMPKTIPYQPLPACERSMIRNWVQQGALNN